MNYFKGKTNNNYLYEANKPSVSSSGRSANFTVYIDDNTLEVDVDFGYDGIRDEVTIDDIYTESYDADCKGFDASGIDLEALFVEVSNKYGTLDKAYDLQAKSYIADHA